MNNKRTPASDPFYQSVYSSYFDKHLAAGLDPEEASKLAEADFNAWAQPPKPEDIVIVTKPAWAYLDIE